MRLFALIFIMTAATFAQNAALEFPLTFKDAAGDSTVLWFGFAPSATDGIDSHLLEEELPPLPPSKVFDARFIGDDISVPQLGLGSYRDFRHGDKITSASVMHELAFQTTNNSKLTIAWDLPENVTGHLIDLHGGTYVNKEMNGLDDMPLTLVTVVKRLLMTVTYQTPSFKVVSPNGGEVLRIFSEIDIQWTSEFVDEDVTLSLSRDNGATFEALAQIENSGSYSWQVDGEPSDACLLKITDSSGNIVDQSDAPFSIQHVTNVSSKKQPEEFVVQPNYPNPFNPQTTIEFYAPHSDVLTAEVLNVQGKRIRTLASGLVSEGSHSIVWKGRDERGAKVAGGVYFYRLRIGDSIHVGKMILTP
jgi:hypothetical protein